jgi:F420H(2)-dependent quinone reductase
MAKHPDDILLEVGKERFKVHAESLEGSARTEALARITAIAPRIGGYQEKTDSKIPIVRLTRELSLSDWHAERFRWPALGRASERTSFPLGESHPPRRRSS